MTVLELIHQRELASLREHLEGPYQLYPRFTASEVLAAVIACVQGDWKRPIPSNGGDGPGPVAADIIIVLTETERFLAARASARWN